ncbi:Hypothetical_protein [Hexamita inflata]|uniref:Hypothetical_protein n=1 Tax=Hexamita inflata TaxID=28002 RepID=A0AA86P204_9EUKA|nr:Hypothetical protein HINF_LOCUS18064 [Hexamita inflata]
MNRRTVFLSQRKSNYVPPQQTDSQIKEVILPSSTYEIDEYVKIVNSLEITDEISQQNQNLVIQCLLRNPDRQELFKIFLTVSKRQNMTFYEKVFELLQQTKRYDCMNFYFNQVVIINDPLNTAKLLPSLVQCIQQEEDSNMLRSLYYYGFNVVSHATVTIDLSPLIDSLKLPSPDQYTPNLCIQMKEIMQTAVTLNQSYATYIQQNGNFYPLLNGFYYLVQQNSDDILIKEVLFQIMNLFEQISIFSTVDNLQRATNVGILNQCFNQYKSNANIPTGIAYYAIQVAIKTNLLAPFYHELMVSNMNSKSSAKAESGLLMLFELTAHFGIENVISGNKQLKHVVEALVSVHNRGLFVDLVRQVYDQCLIFSSQAEVFANSAFEQQ